VRLYLDTSALVKLYVNEEGAGVVRGASHQADVIATSALAYVEARSAFSRRRHEGALSVGEYRRVIHDLDEDWPRYLTIQVVESLIHEAARLADVYRLRDYVAIHPPRRLRPVAGSVSPSFLPRGTGPFSALPAGRV